MDYKGLIKSYNLLSLKKKSYNLLITYFLAMQNKKVLIKGLL